MLSDLPYDCSLSGMESSSWGHQRDEYLWTVNDLQHDPVADFIKKNLNDAASRTFPRSGIWTGFPRLGMSKPSWKFNVARHHETWRTRVFENGTQWDAKHRELTEDGILRDSPCRKVDFKIRWQYFDKKQKTEAYSGERSRPRYLDSTRRYAEWVLKRVWQRLEWIVQTPLRNRIASFVRTGHAEFLLI